MKSIKNKFLVKLIFLLTFNSEFKCSSDILSKLSSNFSKFGKKAIEILKEKIGSFDYLYKKIKNEKKTILGGFLIGGEIIYAYNKINNLNKELKKKDKKIEELKNQKIILKIDKKNISDIVSNLNELQFKESLN